MEMKGIVNINVEQIYMHPENPRKNIGDVTELAESIKKNGVMQNLTVIPGHWTNGVVSEDGWSEEGYTLIIGHRRCAGAKLAGMREVPCMVREGMPLKEQISTMLEENMQRNDLTIFEQAQGFQMMLDLGETEDTIAEKTGFSKATIRHRINIAKLDQSELQSKEQDGSFQLSLTDLYELEKIKDVETRNKILKEAKNSRDISWKVESTLSSLKRNETAEKLIQMMEDMGIKKAPESATQGIYTSAWEMLKSYNLDAKIPDSISVKAKKTDVLYYLKYAYEIRIIRKAPKKPQTEADKARKEMDRKKKEMKAMLEEMNARKREFILAILEGKIDALPKKEVPAVQEELWNALLSMGTYLSISSMYNVYTGKAEYSCTQEEKEAAQKKVAEFSSLHQMLALLNKAMEGVSELYNYYGCYDAEKAAKLMKGYKILDKYGWSFEEDEAKLLDGTHELYVVNGEA